MIRKRGAVGKSSIVLATSAIIIIAAAGFFVFESATNPGGPGQTVSTTNQPSSAAQSTTASTEASANSTISNSQSTPCFIAGESIGVWLRTVSDASGAPLGGVTLTAANTGNQCGNSSAITVTTNSTGWTILPEQLGSYNLTVAYAGRQYPSMDVPMYPVTLSLVTVDLPSGTFSVDVRTYGTNDNFSGPSAISSFGNLSLKMTLANSSVKAGQNLPIRVEFVGSGAWNASYGFQTLRVTNATGTVVFNVTERIPSLSPMTYTSALQDFAFSNGWNANYYPEPAGVPIQPGQYGVTISVEVAGHLFVTTQTVQVVA
jgi:hypothetical protein